MTRDQQIIRLLEQSPSQEARLLAELLKALSWPGEDIQLRNALCGSPVQMDGTDILNTLNNLGYRWDVFRLQASKSSKHPEKGFPLLIRNETGDSTLRLVHSFGEWSKTITGRGPYLAYRFYFEPTRAGELRRWLQGQVMRFRNGIGELYIISLILNLLALVLPFYIRAVYNLEIPGGQSRDLFLLLPFAVAAVFLQVWLMQLRQTKLGRIGGQLDLILSTRVLGKLLRLRLPQLERFTPLALDNRLRSYQGLRTYITGPLALAALDLPFIGIYLVAIAAMSLPLMVLTVLMVVVCFGGIWLVGSAGRAWQETLSRNPSGLDPLLFDLIENLDQIKISGSERIWQERLVLASADQSNQSVEGVRLQQIINIFTGEFSQLTGALVLAVGTGLALAGDGIELGTLIAAMFFVWRVFRPIQMGYQALSRWSQMQPILQQLNQFMGTGDVEPDSAVTQRWILSKPHGSIAFRSVNVRLNALKEPALSQINLQIQAGELVVITGEEGAGSSTLLKLIDAQIPSGSGVVSLDGADIRQYPLSQLRQSVAYLPEDAALFPGTLRENLLLANPVLDDEPLAAMLISLGLKRLLEDSGLDRQVELRGQQSLHPQDIQGIALARALLVDASVRLLDQPFTRLSGTTGQALLDLLKRDRGVVTTLVTTDTPDVMSIADRIVILKEGSIAFNGTPTELLAAQQKAQVPSAT